jgi:hypothetical protein
MTAVGTTLEAEVRAGGLLEGLITLARWDQYEAQPPTPAVIYYGEGMDPPSNSMSIREDWTVPVRVLAYSWNDDPVAGSKQASQYAAAARRVLLRSRNLGLAYVTQVSSGGFDPPNPMNRTSNLFTASAVVKIRFMTDER